MYIDTNKPIGVRRYLKNKKDYLRSVKERISRELAAMVKKPAKN